MPVNFCCFQNWSNLQSNQGKEKKIKLKILDSISIEPVKPFEIFIEDQ